MPIGGHWAQPGLSANCPQRYRIKAGFLEQSYRDIQEDFFGFLSLGPLFGQLSECSMKDIRHRSVEGAQISRQCLRSTHFAFLPRLDAQTNKKSF